MNTPRAITSRSILANHNSTWSRQGHCVIQGYAAQAAVYSSHQVVIAADVIGSGSEQAMLVPMIEQATPCRTADTLVTADAGYHSDANVQHLKDKTSRH